MLASISGATPIAAGRSGLRLGSFIAVTLMVLCGMTAAFLDPDVGPRSGEDTLKGSIAAATIDSFTVNGGTSATVYIDEEVTFVASASSTTSSELTFTFFYDAILDLAQTPNPNSPYSIHSTASPGTVTTTYTYDRLGNLTSSFGVSYYMVKLSVNDGTNTVNMARTVYVVQNSAPNFDLNLEDSYALDPDESIDLAIMVSDPDGDTVSVTWDFGDGAVVVNETGPAPTGVFVNQTHAWSPDIGPGMGPELWYRMVVTLEDPYANVMSQIVNVTIMLPYNGLPVIFLKASTTTLLPGTEMTFFANATDPEGEALTWTFVFNNSIEDVDVLTSHTDVTLPGTKVWNNLTYTFENPGAYTVRLWVSDALIPYQIPTHNVTRSVTMTLIGNSVPSMTDNIQLAVMTDGIPVPVESPSIDKEIGYVTVKFWIGAYDADGDSLTLTWDMADGGEPLVNTSSGGLLLYTFVQIRTFTETGMYNISVVATDGIAGHEVMRHRLVTVTSNNLPPTASNLNFTYELGNFAVPGEIIRFTLVLSDPELDALEVVWDFGDNTSRQYFNVTDYVGDRVTCIANHSYSQAGRYNVTIWYTDNQLGLLNHTKTYKAVVSVSVTYVRVPDSWNWWDYTALALLAAIPILAVLNSVRIRRQRRRLEDKGMTLEEMKLIQSDVIDEPDDFLDKEVD